MTKRIFRSIYLVAVVVFFATLFLIISVLYNYFTGMQLTQLKSQTEFAAHGIENEGAAFFDGLSYDNYRLTWIAADGTVLFDNKGDTSGMDNHLQREEVQEAIESGYGDGSRYSSTLTQQLIYAAQKLSDGTVIRLSTEHHSLYNLLLGMIQPILLVFVFTLALSLFIANRIAKNIVKPLNELDLSHPLESKSYVELAPLLNRLDSQQLQLRAQTRELSRRQREFKAATENMNEGLVLVSSDGTVLSLNKAAQSIFGVSPLFRGKSIEKLTTVVDIAALIERSKFQSHSDAFFEVSGRKYQLSASPFFAEDILAGIVLLIFDITDTERNEQLRREFTANVSHELKTPLHTISGCAELLANNMVSPDDVPQFSSRIYSEAQRMIQLVEDIIKLSHLDEGAADMQTENADIFLLAKTAVQNIRPAAISAGIQISVDGEPAVIKCMPQLISVMISNLCDNAIKYNHDGGSVNVSVKNTTDSVVLTVSDTGIGIPEAHIDRIFERFYRVDKSRSKEVGGTGLGLSIVKHTSRLHNASINIESTLGEGTSISVIFPK